MNIAARKTPSSVCDWIVGRRTDSGCRSGFVSTSSGQRKSFQDASTAKTETTPRIGFDIGSTTETEQAERAGAVDARRLEDLAREVVEEPLHSTTLKALAPAGSQTAQ